MARGVTLSLHRPALLPCRLKPFTSYKFRVKATNDIGDSEYSEESESLTTLQAGQRGLWLLGQGQGVSPAWAAPVPGASPQSHCPLLPTAPEEAPTILSVTPHTTTSVLIRWQVLSLVPSALLGVVGLSPLGGGTEVHWGQSPWGAGDQSSPLTVLPAQAPAEDKINGILLGFRLRYRELVYDSLRGVTLRGIGHPGATWAELTRECWWPC